MTGLDLLLLCLQALALGAVLGLAQGVIDLENDDDDDQGGGILQDRLRENR